MFKRFSRNRYGYSRWDGTQRIEGFDADDILDALSDDYLEDGNLQHALRRLMQEGIRGEDGRRTMGLREMMQRMRNMREQQLNRYSNQLASSKVISVRVSKWSDSLVALPVETSRVNLVRARTVMTFHQNKS